jgi:microcystin-dependent protein
MTCNGLLNVNRLSATGNISFSDSLNNVSATTFGYLSEVTSSIQNQLNTASTAISAILNKTTDIKWTAGQINKTTIDNQCETNTLSFSNTLNNISTTTFSYLSGLTSNIQQQINALNTLPGTVIAFAGSSSTLNGYLFCDGAIYNSTNYSALFNAIGYTYGNVGNGNFRVPDYRAVFLRGAGQQDVQLKIIAGAGQPLMKRFIAPSLGTTVIDQSTYFQTSNYVDSISTTTKTVVTGMSPNLATLSTTSVIGSVNYTNTNDFFNLGNEETHPVHTTVQYFIKY